MSDGPITGEQVTGAPNGDAALWHRIAATVTPLHETRHKRHAKPKAVTPRPAKPAKPHAAERDLPPARPATAPPKQAVRPGPRPLVPGEFVDVDRRTGERLRKGKMAVDAKLDLHGMSQATAHAAVSRFVAAQQAAGSRCVLIVTGKGGRSDDPFSPRPGLGAVFAPRRGVLKEALPRWLNEPALRPYIVAASPASRGHGGAGAVYVLLKRKR